MVASAFTPAVSDATRMGTLIENSGQCTAMRHLVAPGVDSTAVAKTFAGAAEGLIDGAADSLATGSFFGLYRGWGDSFPLAPGYTAHPDPKIPMAFKIATGSQPLPPVQIEEHWRRPYLDVSSPPSPEALASKEYLDAVAKWLVTTQPITLAINHGDSEHEDFSIAASLFERTSQVVYSVG